MSKTTGTDAIAWNGSEYRILFPDLLRELTAEEDADLGAAIQAADNGKGKIIKAIVTDGRGGIIDGIHRLRWAVKLGLPRSAASFDPAGRGMNADQQREMCLQLNDTGRQDSWEIRKANRVARVAEARASGQSIRTIAEAEGVSVATVHGDLEASGVQGGEHLTESNGKVTGKDGKSYPKSKPPILCERCKGIGRETPTTGCSKCQAERAKAKHEKKKAKKKKKTEARAVLKDRTGKVLPDSCRDAFADTQLEEMIATLEGVAGQFKPEPWVKKAGKLCDHFGFVLIEKFNDHLHESLSRLQLAIEALSCGIPYAVCPKCEGVDSKKDGKCCRSCRGFGHVPQHRYEELTRA